MRKKKASQMIMGAIVLFFLAAVLVSVFFIVRLACSYLSSRKANAMLSEIALQTPEPAPTASPAVKAIAEPVAAKEAAPSAELPVTVDWEELKSVNREIAAWLYCEGTPINYPVVQHKDNEYYIGRNAQRKKDDAGALFFDCRNNVGVDGENMIIYGHRMRDNSMFGVLPEYSDMSYYDRHPEMYLLTPDRNFRIDIFACRTVRATIKYFPTSFCSRDAFLEYAEKANGQSYWQNANYINSEGVALLTLVTCSNYSHADNPRLQVMGWAIPLD